MDTSGGSTSFHSQTISVLDLGVLFLEKCTSNNTNIYDESFFTKVING